MEQQFHIICPKRIMGLSGVWGALCHALLTEAEFLAKINQFLKANFTLKVAYVTTDCKYGNPSPQTPSPGRQSQNILPKPPVTISGCDTDGTAIYDEFAQSTPKIINLKTVEWCLNLPHSTLKKFSFMLKFPGNFSYSVLLFHFKQLVFPFEPYQGKRNPSMKAPRVCPVA